MQLLRMLQFTQRSTLILYLLLHRKEMSRIICLSELSHILSVIVLVAETHFLHKRRWTNRSMSPKKGWCSEVLPMTAMKRWPYWRFHRTVKKTENTLQAKRDVVRYRVYQTVDIAVTKEKLDLLLPKV